jgi:hypothetical protein
VLLGDARILDHHSLPPRPLFPKATSSSSIRCQVG